MATVAFTTRANLVGGQPENIADVTSCLDALLAGVNSVADTQLASPANAIWRTLQTWDMSISGGSTAGLYYASAGTAFCANGSLSTGPRQYQVSATDSAVVGKTTKYRWAYNYATNGVAPNQAITLDPRIVTGVGGASSGGANITLGAAQPGPAVSFTPSAAGISASASTAVVIADGTYTLGITLAGTTAATSYLFLSVSLQMQHV